MPSAAPGPADVAGVDRADRLRRAAAANAGVHYDPDRWSHLPGNGRGVVQPNNGKRVGVAVRKSIGPAFLIGLAVVAVVVCIYLVPRLFQFNGVGTGPGVRDSRTSVENGEPVATGPGPARPAASGRPGGPRWSAVTVGRKTFTLVGYADTSTARERGLQGRRLKPNQAQYFAFPGPSTYGFWMQGTPGPLSVLFLANGRVVDSAYMPACSKKCPTYKPRVAIDAAIEIRPADGVGLVVGDRIGFKAAP